MRGVALALLLGVAACAMPGEASPWSPLFDGASLAGWRAVGGGGAGPVRVVDGRLRLGQGEPVTAVALSEPLASDFPRDDFELEVVAARTLGNDFFVGLTFPAGAGELTLILGGWGGGLCGLSCLDGEDAARNETKSFRRFERGRDYRVVVRVEQGRVRATVDDELVAEVGNDGRRRTLRGEVEACRPVGLATWQTAASIRSVRWRRIVRRA